MKKKLDLYYPKWIIQRGFPIEVEKIKFLGYVKRDGYTHVFKENGISYIGERWKCKNINTGETLEGRFKEEFSGDDSEIGYEYTPLGDTIQDNIPNPIVDDWESVEMFLNGETMSYRSSGRVRRNPNLDLELFSKRADELEESLWKFYKSRHSKYPLREVIMTRYKMELEPNLKSARAWNKFSKESRIRMWEDFKEFNNPITEI